MPRFWQWPWNSLAIIYLCASSFLIRKMEIMATPTSHRQGMRIRVVKIHYVHHRVLNSNRIYTSNCPISLNTLIHSNGYVFLESCYLLVLICPLVMVNISFKYPSWNPKNKSLGPWTSRSSTQVLHNSPWLYHSV